jgi:hypothetical protein
VETLTAHQKYSIPDWGMTRKKDQQNGDIYG